jgi:hypothetical protein
MDFSDPNEIPACSCPQCRTQISTTTALDQLIRAHRDQATLKTRIWRNLCLCLGVALGAVGVAVGALGVTVGAVGGAVWALGVSRLTHF